MAAPRPSTASGLLCGCVAAVLALSCGATGQSAEPESLPPQTMSRAAEPSSSPDAAASGPVELEPLVYESESQLEAVETGSEQPAEPEPAVTGSEPDADSSIVMIETPDEAEVSESATLVQAAQAERNRRHDSEPAEIVITNKNLDEYATGQLTVAETETRVKTADEDDFDAKAALAEDEAFWRGRGRDIRQSWADAADRVIELEEDVFKLRQQFYATDDGFYRDSTVKPAWDRAIEQLDAAREEVDERQTELADFLEEGRQAGALAGWLREGIELEPTLETEPSKIHEPSEPPVYQEDDG